MQAIIYCYRSIADFNALVGSSEYIPPQRVQHYSKLTRRCYIALLQCAQAAGAPQNTQDHGDEDIEEIDGYIDQMLDTDDSGQPPPQEVKVDRQGQDLRN